MIINGFTLTYWIRVMLIINSTNMIYTESALRKTRLRGAESVCALGVGFSAFVRLSSWRFDYGNRM